MMGIRLGMGIGRRASGVVSFDPSSIAGLVLDMNADVGVTVSDTDKVDIWANQGSAGGTFAGTTTGRPSLAASGVNGSKAIVFDGMDDELISAKVWTDLLPDASSWTCFALMQYVGGSATGAASYNCPALLADQANGDRSLVILGNTEPMVGMFHWGSGDNNARDTTHLAAGTDQVITGYYDAAGARFMSVQVDGQTPVVTTPIGAPGFVGGGALLMGRNYSGAVHAGYKLRRLLMYSALLTAPQIAQVKAYLASF